MNHLTRDDYAGALQLARAEAQAMRGRQLTRGVGLALRLDLLRSHLAFLYRHANRRHPAQAGAGVSQAVAVGRPGGLTALNKSLAKCADRRLKILFLLLKA